MHDVFQAVTKMIVLIDRFLRSGSCSSTGAQLAVRGVPSLIPREGSGTHPGRDRIAPARSRSDGGTRSLASARDVLDRASAPESAPNRGKIDGPGIDYGMAAVTMSSVL